MTSENTNGRIDNNFQWQRILIKKQMHKVTQRWGYATASNVLSLIS